MDSTRKFDCFFVAYVAVLGMTNTDNLDGAWTKLK